MPILRVNFFGLPLNYNFQITCAKHLQRCHKNKFRGGGGVEMHISNCG